MDGFTIIGFALSIASFGVGLYQLKRPQPHPKAAFVFFMCFVVLGSILGLLAFAKRSSPSTHGGNVAAPSVSSSSAPGEKNANHAPPVEHPPLEPKTVSAQPLIKQEATGIGNVNAVGNAPITVNNVAPRARNATTPQTRK
jgi:hypothetical protein